MVLQKIFNLRPNRYKVIITSILIFLTFVSFMYVFSYGICDPPTCPVANPIILSVAYPLTYTYYPFYIQNDLADSIVYKITYINENTHTVESKYPMPVEYTIRGIFILLILSIYLILNYIAGCCLYNSFILIKNKFSGSAHQKRKVVKRA